MSIDSEDIRAFVEKVNEGRAAFGLSALVEIDFDGSDPGSTSNCLSARHLLGPVLKGQDEPTDVGSSTEGSVSSTLFHVTDEDKARRLATALGVEPYREPVAFADSTRWYIPIPEEIQDVTRVFDDLADRPGEDVDEFRETLSEAGYAPWGA